MKNILIMGVGRTGKTTLSEMIKNEFKSYNLLHSDSIKWGIIRANNKEEYYRNNIDEQSKWEHSETFQKTLLEIFTSHIRNDINNHGYILETGQLEPKIVSEMLDLNKTIVICLGHGKLKTEDIINLCRNNDTPDDWSYDISDSDLKQHAETWNKLNEKLKVECQKYGIRYIDTSTNRNQILKELLEEIKNINLN